MKSKIVILCLGLLYGSCGEQSIREEQAAEEKSFNPVPGFNADSAYAFIQQQVDFGPRVPNTPAHRETGDWLTGKLAAYGFSVSEQEFTARAYDGKELQLRNIIGSYRPEASKRILLAAHWDTRRIADKDSERIDEPIDGANDGGSGVGVLLEIARVLHTDTLQPDVGIDIIFFDGEDDGEPEHRNFRDGSQVWWCLGSQHWSKNPHARGYTAFYGILVDMVGGKNARFYKEGYSIQYAKNLVDRVWNYAHELGYGDFFPMRKTEAITDDHLFVNQDANIPMINIIEFSPDYGFGHYHHTHQDNMDLIDRKSLEVVGETVLFTIFQE
ncbi:M28 family peptidase [Cyclobacterium sp. SYSU L10401]|uniref:M28 family peptidase n=1 Tax=Cyclobacterium sp. SYSU L10401 TaxID=2678657 RepID=UPI0013D6488D|nr:M28 family peptidase [Cyclobacterium sp. SYSU L10401]